MLRTDGVFNVLSIPSNEYWSIRFLALLAKRALRESSVDAFAKATLLPLAPPMDRMSLRWLYWFLSCAKARRHPWTPSTGIWQSISWLSSCETISDIAGFPKRKVTDVGFPSIAYCCKCVEDVGYDIKAQWWRRTLNWGSVVWIVDRIGVHRDWRRCHFRMCVLSMVLRTSMKCACSLVEPVRSFGAKHGEFIGVYRRIWSKKS